MELLTQRLLLRPFRAEDCHAVAQGLNNINVARNLARVKFPYQVEDARQWFELQKGFDPRSVIRAIAFRAAPDELIGTISYETRDQADAVFGYWLREFCWHIGLMSEAAAALVHYAFTSGEVEALASAYHKDNPHSGHILGRLGFVENRETMSDCLALNIKVPSIQLRLTREAWFAKPLTQANF